MVQRGVVVALAVAAMLGLAASPASASSGGRYIVVLRGETRAHRALAAAEALPGVHPTFRYTHALTGFAARLSPQALDSLRRDPRVAYVMPDRRVSLADGSAAPAATSNQAIPFALARIGMLQDSDPPTGHSRPVDTGVAVIDTGVGPHSDLRIAGGVDCGPGNLGFADVNGHGTGVAGVIAAKDNQTGVVGVAHGARIWAVRVLDANGSGEDSNFLCGMDWVVAHAHADHITVANMSLTGPGADSANCGTADNDALHEAICAMQRAGVTAVAAAGNADSDIAGVTPAAYDQVLTVTAMADYDGLPGGKAAPMAACPYGADDSYATFSNYATLHEDRLHTLAASGTCVRTTYPGDLYATFSGTSFAAPAVAGTAALCIAEGPCKGLPPAKVRARIMSDSAAHTRNDHGYGFQGDPLRPVDGHWYGFLDWVGGY